MKAKPANTSFPPLISQTTKATTAAGKMKKMIFTMTIIIMIPNIRRINGANQPIGPNDPRKSDTRNRISISLATILEH